MKADALLNWEKAELARILAEEYADADDLLEAIPELARVGGYEVEQLPGYIDKNWMRVLRLFDLPALEEWVEKQEMEAFWRELDEEWEQWKTEQMMEAAEYNEMLEQESVYEFIEEMASFHSLDFAGLMGYPGQRISS